MTLLEQLRELSLDHVADIGGHKIKANKQRSICDANGNGCTGCIFFQEAGAAECSLRDACMAHKRPDKKSVIFKQFINPQKNKRS